MNNITKKDLLDQVEDIIEESKKLKQSSKFPGLYDTSTHLLEKMKKAINTDHSLTKNELEKPSTSLDIFSSKEVDNYDEKFASKLSDLTYRYDNYYKLLDPHIEKRLAEMQERNKK